MLSPAVRAYLARRGGGLPDHESDAEDSQLDDDDGALIRVQLGLRNVGLDGVCRPFDEAANGAGGQDNITVLLVRHVKEEL